MAFAFNPFSGNLDVVAYDGFLPYNTIAADLSIIVPADREMNIVNELIVLGALDVQGTVNPLDLAIEEIAVSTANTYNGDGTVNYVEHFSSATQVTANRIYRIDFTYNGDLTVATEIQRTYSKSNGTTVIRTVTYAYTYSSGILTSTLRTVS